MKQSLLAKRVFLVSKGRYRVSQPGRAYLRQLLGPVVGLTDPAPWDYAARIMVKTLIQAIRISAPGLGVRSGSCISGRPLSDRVPCPPPIASPSTPTPNPPPCRG